MSGAWDFHAFRARLALLRDMTSAADLLRGALDAFGFVAFNYGAPNITGSMLSSMDRAWVERYLDSGYFRTDRLVVAASKRTAPFLASEIFTDAPASVPEAEMQGAISAFADGLVIPIHCPVVGFAVLAAYIARGDTTLTSDLRTRADLSLLALTFHQGVRSLYAGNPKFDGRSDLSAREGEILHWSAAGKTATDIAQLLKLSPNTVRNHLAAARRKLNTRNTAAAVAIHIGGEWSVRSHDQN